MALVREPGATIVSSIQSERIGSANAGFGGRGKGLGAHSRKDGIGLGRRFVVCSSRPVQGNPKLIQVLARRVSTCPIHSIPPLLPLQVKDKKSTSVCSEQSNLQNNSKYTTQLRFLMIFQYEYGNNSEFMQHQTKNGKLFWCFPVNS